METILESLIRSFTQLMKLPSYNGALGKTLAKILPDTPWASYLLSCRVFRRNYGFWPRLRQPRTFNEWLFKQKVMLPKSTSFAPWVDKQLAKDFVSSALKNCSAPCRVAKTLHHTSSADDAFFRGVVPRCVIKGTHGSGMTILVREPRLLTDEEKASLHEWLAHDYFWGSREPSYRHLTPAVIAEEFLPSGEQVPEDYKFFCFRGQVAFIQHDADRYGNHTRCLYSPDWRRMNVSKGIGCYEADVPPPPDLASMLAVAECLSLEHDFVRVDLYQTDEGVFFGEMTFFPGSGLSPFKPISFDESIYQQWLANQPPTPRGGNGNLIPACA